MKKISPERFFDYANNHKLKIEETDFCKWLSEAKEIPRQNVLIYKAYLEHIGYDFKYQEALDSQIETMMLIFSNYSIKKYQKRMQNT